MMNLRCAAVRVAVRQCRHPVWQLSAARVAGLSYHSYPLPSKTPDAPRNSNIPSSSIAQPDPLPRVHETRPPPQHDAVPVPPPPASTSQSSQLKAEEAEAQKPKRSAAASTSTSTSTSTSAAAAAAARPRSKLRARKAAMKITPEAVEQLRALLDQPEPKLIKVGVKNRGCSGLAYNLEYVDKPGPFDETVEQDGVKVLIDSKALFSIIGSEMDWAEDKLSQRFVFKNPNIKESCGCGESFMV